MSNPNLKPTMRATVLAAIEPANLAIGAINSTASVDMGEFANAVAVVTTGVFATDATAEIKFQQATTAAFADAKDIAGTTPLALSARGTAALNIRAKDLDLNNGFRFVRPVVTVAVAKAHAAVAVLGFDARNQPATALAGTVVE